MLSIGFLTKAIAIGNPHLTVLISEHTIFLSYLSNESSHYFTSSLPNSLKKNLTTMTFQLKTFNHFYFCIKKDTHCQY